MRMQQMKDCMMEPSCGVDGGSVELDGIGHYDKLKKMFLKSN